MIPERAIAGTVTTLIWACLMAPQAQAEIIDRTCMMRHLCAMASPCISQEQAITVRLDTTAATVQFGLNERASELQIMTYADGVLTARSSQSERVENAMLSVFPDGTMAYTVHLINESGTGLGLSAFGTCSPLEDG